MASPTCWRKRSSDLLSLLPSAGAWLAYGQGGVQLDAPRQPVTPIIPSSSSTIKAQPPLATTFSPSPAVIGYDRYYDPTYRLAVGETFVPGYYRSNGTYVQGHWRTNPDNSFWNNWSSKGNVNPHTGKVGARTRR